MKIYVSVKNLNDLQVNGNGKIISENSIASDYITLGVAGGGSMDVDLKGNTVKAELSGSGLMTVKGYATSMDAVVSGSGTLDGYKFALETAKAKVSGTGLCQPRRAERFGWCRKWRILSRTCYPKDSPARKESPIGTHASLRSLP